MRAASTQNICHNIKDNPPEDVDDKNESVNGTQNVRASWSCSGFEGEVVIDKYPSCPEGGKVLRVHDFPSCWDGKNTDSKNHRDHIVSPNANGSCKRGFKPVPQLRVTLVDDIPARSSRLGSTRWTPSPRRTTTRRPTTTTSPP